MARPECDTSHVCCFTKNRAKGVHSHLELRNQVLSPQTSHLGPNTKASHLGPEPIYHNDFMFKLTFT
jgi:hypothetical protein